MASMVHPPQPRLEQLYDPDGRPFWIDRRPSLPTWEDPRQDPQAALPAGVDEHTTPNGRKFWIDKRPRTTWTKPPEETQPLKRDSPSSTTLNLTTEAMEMHLPSQESTAWDGLLPTHPEVKLLLSLSRWRIAQVLSGYPDSRAPDVDMIISLLNSRISALPQVSELRPLEGWFIKGAHDLISSQPNLNFLSLNNTEKHNKNDESIDVLHVMWLSFVKPLLYFLLLGAPGSYKQRMAKADWIQWASSKRWTDQQQAIDGFLKSLLAEWNLIILLSTLLLSATVGFLALQDLGRVPASAVLISLIFSLSGLVLSVAFVWRYQRQLNNTYDIRRVMNEFIFDADEEVLPLFLSLPVAFLLWSVICFAVGVVSYSWSRLPNLESPVGVTAALIMVVVISVVTWILHRNMWVWKRGWRSRIRLGGGSNKGQGDSNEMISLHAAVEP